MSVLVALLLATGTPDLADRLRAAAEADLRLRREGTCRTEDLEVIRQALAALEPVAGTAPAPRWRFPLDRVVASASLGGTRGDGYRVARKKACYAWKEPGHPAHDLFVPDPDQDSRDPEGRPWHALAIDDGLVLVARSGWTPADDLKGGNYVMLYLPARRQIAYYAHLESILVAAGTPVARGTRLGVLGRTGRNAWPRRSPTHLHFALWDARTLTPLDPYRELLRAE